MKYFLILFLCFSPFLFAQQQKTFTHKVIKGETIYQISKKYGVSIQELYKVNPEAEIGLAENAILVIPNTNSISYVVKKENASNEAKIHTVVSKETVYGIAKQHSISIPELEKANSETLINGIKVGQELVIPVANSIKNTPVLAQKSINANQYIVKIKENLFSIARQFNVSVQDLEEINKEILTDGLQIGEVVTIPNKKKTLSGQARVINIETLFHVVLPKETKFSIAKKYGITIEQLETQNPEIINGLVEGNKLAINKNQIKANNENEELMIALAEKQVAIEKSKAKTLEIEDLQDKLIVQKQMNQKVLKVNSLKVNLNAIDETKEGSAAKLKLVLEANKNIQEILISKLDSLVVTMNDDLVELKSKEIDLDESKSLEKESYKNIGQTNLLLNDLKRDLADNRKIYTGLMQKVQRVTVSQNFEYKKKVRENSKKTVVSTEDTILLNAIDKIKIEQEKNEKTNKKLFSKIDSIGVQRTVELRRRISKATFYSAEARDYDDKLALVKLKRYQKNAIETNKELALKDKAPKKSKEEIRKSLKNNEYNESSAIKIQVLKNLKEVANGYYIVAAVFKEAEPRDLFSRKLTDSGETKTAFFFNVNIFSYFVYSKKVENVEEALYEYNTKKTNPLFKEMFIVLIENE